MDIPSFEALFDPIHNCAKVLGLVFYSSSLSLLFFVTFSSIALEAMLEFGFLISKFSKENFLELTGLVPCFGIAVLTLLKLESIASNRNKIVKLLDCLKESYEEILDNPEKRALIAKDTVLVKRFTKYNFILNAILVTLYNFFPPTFMLYLILKKGVVHFIVPFATILPFALDSWGNWAVAYFFAIFAGFACVLGFVTVDALYYNLSSQVCCNFSALSHDVAKLTPANAHTLRDIIKRHQYVLKLSDMLEEIFTFPNLCNVLVGSILICALGFNITAGDLVNLPQNLLFLVSQILQMLVMSVFGENILQESQKVKDSAYFCKWLEMKPKDKKMILILMMRATKPSKLTTYKFSVISYGSFTKIMSTSWSYFTILRTIYK